MFPILWMNVLISALLLSSPPKNPSLVPGSWLRLLYIPAHYCSSGRWCIRHKIILEEDFMLFSIISSTEGMTIRKND